MSDDEELCGAPGPAGQTCTMPKGHDPEMHGFMVELTPDLGQLIESMLERAESERKRYEKSVRRNNWAFGALIVATAVNIFGVFSTIF